MRTLNRKYMVFLTYRDKFDIVEQTCVNRTQLETELRSMGYKVALTLTKGTYEDYQNVDSQVFFDAYPFKFNEYRVERIKEIMFGEGEKG